MPVAASAAEAARYAEGGAVALSRAALCDALPNAAPDRKPKAGAAAAVDAIATRRTGSAACHSGGVDMGRSVDKFLAQQLARAQGPNYPHDAIAQEDP